MLLCEGEMSDVVFVVGGEAGQGLNVVETILIKFLKASGLYIYSSKEYMSVVRGDVNYCNNSCFRS